MRGLQSFYRAFYGHRFYRHFRRPPDYSHKHFQIQYTVTCSKNLYVHVHRNSGHHHCFTHVYDYGSRANLKIRNTKKMLFDRAFFDFDVSHPEVKIIKEQLLNLRSQGLGHGKVQQEKLVEELNRLIIKEKVSKEAIDEAKDFAIKFKETFGQYPALFFSGCKGCHAYTFFRATNFKDINLALSWFAQHVKDTYNYQTLDLSVNKDAMARLSRVPYNKHQLTGLSVVPFTIDDSYADIMRSSRNPRVHDFQREDYSTNFHEHLQKIDLVESHNSQIKSKLMKKPVLTWKDKKSSKLIDHQEFFKSLLGMPEREYPAKKYVMYHCPFKDHEDKKPSFMVHAKGYKCYGCGKKGNYWQFFKDFHGWNNEMIREFLMKKRE